MQRFLFILLSLSTLAIARPCPVVWYDFKHPENKIEWIVEGTIVDIIKTGTFTDCEDMGDMMHCTEVDQPELIILENAKVVKGNVFMSKQGRVVLSRKSHCFSKPMSIMNSKPELNSIGKQMRFYGNQFYYFDIRPGYFYVQPIESHELPPSLL
jgi:hypothetical protein